MTRDARPPDRHIWIAAAIALVGLSPVLAGFLPGRVLLPIDQLFDAGAWKPDPTSRVSVSNRLDSDPVVQFYPWDEAARRCLKAGELPWRNAFSGEGSPLFVNPQAALLSPFTWPRLLFGIRGWTLAVALKLLALALGFFWLTREMGAGRDAALLSSLVSLGSGFAVVWMLHPNTNVLAVLPALGAALLRLRRAVTRANLLAVVALAALATAGGHPETLALGVTGLFVFLVWESLAAPGSRRWILWGLGAAACGFLLVAIQIVPFLFLLRGSPIAEIRSARNPAPVRYLAAVGQVLPGFLGSPIAGEVDLAGTASGAESFVGRGQGFVGAITLAILLLSVRRIPASFRRGLWVGVVALAIAWRVPGLFALRRLLPLVSIAQPDYWVVPFVFFACAAAGPALMSLPREGRAIRIAGVILAVSGLVLFVVGVAPCLPSIETRLVSAIQSAIGRLRSQGFLRLSPEVYLARLPGYVAAARRTALHRIALPGACWALAGWSLLRVGERSRWLVAAMLVELFGFGYGYVVSVPNRRIPGVPPAVEAIQRLDPSARWRIAAGVEVYPPNLATLHGLRDIRSYDLLETRRWVETMRSLRYDFPARAFRMPIAQDQVEKLGDAGVKYVLSRAAIPGAGWVGGGVPPAVGAYELERPVPVPKPANTPPEGLGVGVLLSAAGAAFSALLLLLAHRFARSRGDEVETH